MHQRTSWPRGRVDLETTWPASIVMIGRLDFRICPANKCPILNTKLSGGQILKALLFMFKFMDNWLNSVSSSAEQFTWFSLSRILQWIPINRNWVTFEYFGYFVSNGWFQIDLP